MPSRILRRINAVATAPGVNNSSRKNGFSRIARASAICPFYRVPRMDLQTVLNTVGGLATLIVAAYVKFVQTQLESARQLAVKAADKLEAFTLKAAENYVTHSDLRKIEESLIRIEATLNAKQDKSK